MHYNSIVDGLQEGSMDYNADNKVPKKGETHCNAGYQGRI